MFTLDQRMDEMAAVSGTEGICYAMLPDGRRPILANVLKFEAKVKFQKKAIPILGRKTKANKKGLAEGTGSMTMHYNTSIFREMAQEYKNTGRDGYFDLMIVNDDEGSIVGTQKVVLKRVNFDELTVAMLDAESEYLTEDLAFTFDDWDLREGFNTKGLREI